MERSKAEHALSRAVVNAPPPSDLALDAIVAGVPVAETRQSGIGADVVWPDEPTTL